MIACTLAAWSLATWLVLIPVRGYLMGYDWYWLKRPLTDGWVVLAGSYLDLLYIGGLALAFSPALLLPGRPPVRRLSWTLFGVAIAGSLVWALVNVPIVKMLGQPLNYAWLYNSGFLRFPAAFEGLFAALTAPVLLIAGGAVAGFVMLGLALQWLFRRLGWRSLAVLAACLVAYVPLSRREVGNFYYPMLRNPVVAFAASLLPEDPPRIFTMATRAAPDDFVQGRSRSAELPPLGDARIRNVVVIVLESVAAEYLPAYGGRYPITPALDRYRDRTRIFDAIQAHAPNTNKTMLSLLCSVYPSPTYLLETKEYSEGAFVAVSEVLKQQGYRTGLFYAADLRFGNADVFLSHRQFDALRDHRSIGDGKPNCISREAMPFLDAVDDATVGRDMLAWITAASDKPFFALMWSGQTHYPYFNMDRPVSFEGVAEMEARYLNALRETDQAVGAVLGGLEEKGLLDSTLVVVIGDHGEAFGQHSQYGHGSRLYNENVRVPLLLINRGLFKGEHDATVGGTVDIAPTILHALGAKAPAGWQGESLLAAHRSGRTYFVAPWSGALFGYREGNRKFILRADEDRCESYDLASDPGELHDLAGSMSAAEREQVRERLASWVQYQAPLLEQLGKPVRAAR